MENILVINGSEPRGYAKGAYNQSLCNVMRNFFYNQGHDFQITFVNDDYDADEEADKLAWAQVIIWQFPVYWFHMPGKMKTYIDRVFMAGRNKIWLNDGRAQGGAYGSGGLMQDKRYMLSTTWNAPSEAFNDPQQLFDGKNIDDVFFAFHKMMDFMGADALPSFSCHDVVRNADIAADEERLEEHLAKIFAQSA